MHLEFAVIEEAGAGGQVRPRTIDAEKVGESGDGDAEIGRRFFAPLPTKGYPAAADTSIEARKSLCRKPVA